MEMKKQTAPSTSRSVAMAPNWSSPTSTTTTTSTSSASASALGLHKNSRPISKMKPKIRIIHIFAPEIIKTDAANFRELVQRLTGKPTHQDLPAAKKKPRKAEERGRSNHHHHQAATSTCYDYESRSVVKAEEEEECKYEFWNNDINYDVNNTTSGSGSGSGSGGGFLGGFPDLDGYFNTHEFGEFPLLYHPLLDAHHTMHVYEHDPRLIA